MTDTTPPFEPRPAYAQLLALALEMRPDWNRTELRDAMTAVHLAGWPWKDVFREVNRLAWAEDETPATLRNSARRPVPAQASGPEVNARGREAVMAAFDRARRVTGEQKVLTEGNDDSRHGAGA
jgi:hypothetical protein